ncbi:hypothetical protein PMIN03_001232 [Paraphaeosphaeria minitans]
MECTNTYSDLAFPDPSLHQHGPIRLNFHHASSGSRHCFGEADSQARRTAHSNLPRHSGSYTLSVERFGSQSHILIRRKASGAWTSKGIVYTSGTVPSVNGTIVAGGIREQTAQVIKNIAATLDEA